MFGPLLTIKIISMIFWTFFIMLILSNVITSISTIYLAEDLEYLFSQPIKITSIFLIKFFETLLQSSWMILFISVPIFLVYIKVFKSSIFAFFYMIFSLIPFFVLCTSLSILVTMILAKFFPIKKIRKITLLLGVIFTSGIIILLQILQPTRLVNPAEALQLYQFLAELKLPIAPYSPSGWVSDSIISSLKGKLLNNSFILLLLVSAILFIFIIFIGKKLMFNTWLLSQESYSKKKMKKKYIFSVFLFFFPKYMKNLIEKDLKIIIRDPSQLPQLLLLLSIMILYLINVKNLPITQLPESVYSTTIRSIIFFLNIAFVGFIISAVAVRFTFPVISLEGKSFWVIRCAPISMKRLLWSKFIVHTFFLLILAEILILASCYIMKVDLFIAIISIVSVFLITLGVSGLGIGLGAIYPKFDISNPTEVATSLPGFLYMALSFIFILTIVAIEAGFVGRYYLSQLLSVKISFKNIFFMSIILLILTGITTYLPVRIGERHLSKQEL
jgi:ABC-2 type transport system permease protein